LILFLCEEEVVLTEGEEEEEEQEESGRRGESQIIMSVLLRVWIGEWEVVRRKFVRYMLCRCFGTNEVPDYTVDIRAGRTYLLLWEALFVVL
jgi:hypothetical protein